MSSPFSPKNQPGTEPTFWQFFRSKLGPMLGWTMWDFRTHILGIILAILVLVRLFNAFSSADLTYFQDNQYTGVAKKGLSVRWLGVAGLEIRYGNKTVLIDPFFSRPSILDILLRFDSAIDTKLIAKISQEFNYQAIDAVFVSHSHYDHSMDAPYFVKKSPGARLFGSESTLNIGRGFGLKEKQLQKTQHGAVFRFGKIEVTVLESKHGPALFGRVPFPGKIDAPLRYPIHPSAYRLGKTYSYLIQTPAGCLVHHGSAETLNKTFTGIKCDTVLIGVAGRADTETYLTKVAGKLEAQRIFPIHFDNFLLEFQQDKPPLLWNVKLGEFVSTSRRLGYQVQFLPYLQKVNL